MHELIFRNCRVHRRILREFWGYLDQRLADQYRNWIQIRPMSFKSEPLCLQRNGAASREGVEDGRRVSVC